MAVLAARCRSRRTGRIFPPRTRGRAHPPVPVRKVARGAISRIRQGTRMCVLPICLKFEPYGETLLTPSLLCAAPSALSGQHAYYFQAIKLHEPQNGYGLSQKSTAAGLIRVRVGRRPLKRINAFGGFYRRLKLSLHVSKQADITEAEASTGSEKSRVTLRTEGRRSRCCGTKTYRGWARGEHPGSDDRSSCGPRPPEAARGGVAALRGGARRPPP